LGRFGDAFALAGLFPARLWKARKTV